MTDKQDDVEALLASLTEPTTPQPKPKQNAPEADELRTFGERAGTFKIDPRDSHISGTDKLRKNSEALGINPEDFTNHLALRKESARRKKLFIGLGLSVFLLILGYVGYTMVQANTTQATYTIPSNDTEEQRFLNLYPNAPQADPAATTKAQTSDRGLDIPNGYALTFAGMNFASLDYQAVKSSDFGPAAVANVEGPWKGTTVYLFKDMAHSKAFAEAWDGTPVTVEGSPGAAVMFMQLSSGVHAVLAILNPDSTGYMIVLPDNLNYETAENLASSVRIEKSTAEAPTINPDLVSPANFGNKCSPQYGKPTSDLIGGEEAGSQRVNTVSVPFETETLRAMKFSDGEVYRFLSSGSQWIAADQKTYDATIDAFKNAGNFDEELIGEEKYRTSVFDKVSKSDQLETLDACLDILDTP